MYSFTTTWLLPLFSVFMQSWAGRLTGCSFKNSLRAFIKMSIYSFSNSRQSGSWAAEWAYIGKWWCEALFLAVTLRPLKSVKLWDIWGGVRSCCSKWHIAVWIQWCFPAVVCHWGRESRWHMSTVTISEWCYMWTFIFPPRLKATAAEVSGLLTDF